MSLTDDIKNLPASPREVMPGHLDHHATIHSALKNQNSRLWDQGGVPPDATSISDLEPGSWRVQNATQAEIVDSPGLRMGSLWIGMIGTSKAATFISQGNTSEKTGLWVKSQRLGEWSEWVHLANKADMDAADEDLGQRIDAADTALGQRIDAVDTALGQRIDAVDTDLRERMDAADTALGERMDTADTTLGKRIDLLFPSSIRAGQVLRWDGTKFVPSWLDQHTDLYDNTY